MRCAEWSHAKRLSYVLAAPLIPFVRLRRLLALLVRSSSLRQLLPRIMPVLVGAVAIDGIGELVGYATGPGSSSSILGGIEFDRRRTLNRADQKAYDVEEARYRRRA